MRKLVMFACIFSLLVSATLVVGCVLEDSRPQTPKVVVQEFLDELASGDTNTAWDALSEKSQKLLGSESEFDSLVREILPNGDELESARVAGTSTKGNAATVTFTVVIDGKTETDTVSLVKEDGVWKISLEPDEK